MIASEPAPQQALRNLATYTQSAIFQIYPAPEFPASIPKPPIRKFLKLSGYSKIPGYYRVYDKKKG